MSHNNLFFHIRNIFLAAALISISIKWTPPQKKFEEKETVGVSNYSDSR